MVKSTHVAFPQDGVELLVSAEDALAYGINPGEPAVVEVTVRPHTVEEWITEASQLAPGTEDEHGDVSGSGSDPIPGGEISDRPLIRWKSAAEPEPEPEPEPIPSTGGEEPTRIRWESGRGAG
jgi:hypothetical protein